MSQTPFKDQDVLDLIKFHKAEQGEEMEQISEALSWYNGTYWGSERTAGSDAVEIHTNYLYALVDSISATLVPQNPRASITPLEPKVVDAARRAEKMLDKDAQATDLDAATRRLVRWAVLAGRCPGKVVWDTRVQAPRFYQLDPRSVWWNYNVPFDESEYVINATLMPDRQIKELIKGGKYDPLGYKEAAPDTQMPPWLQSPGSKGGGKTGSGLQKQLNKLYKFRVVYEVVFPDENLVYHILDGAKHPLFMGPCPYPNVRRNFVMLHFNDALEHHKGIADVGLIRNLQQRLNELDQLALEHAHRSIPGALYDKRGLSEEEASAIADMEPGEMHGVTPPNGLSVRDTVAPIPTPSLIPDFHRMTMRVEGAMQFITGLPDWQRGQISGAPTATELALTDQSLRNRLTLRSSQIRKVHKQIFERFVILRQSYMDPKSTIVVGTIVPGVPPESSSVADLAAILDVDIVAYDPVEYNKALRRVELRNLLNETASFPWVDHVGLQREVFGLYELDPALVLDQAAPPAEAAAEGAEVAALEAAAAAGAGGNVIPMNGGAPPPTLPPG